MRNGKTKSSSKVQLRRRAEEQLEHEEKNRPENDQEHSAQEKMQRLYQELQVHQIELEMQNDELRTTQERIEDSRSQLEDLYDFSPLGYFTFDRKGLIRAVNLTGSRLLGIDRESLIKSPFSGFIDTRSLNVFFSHLDQVFTGEAKQVCELRLKTKKGRHVDIALESIRTENSQGDISQCRSAVINITARKQAEEILRESEELFRLTFDKSPIGAAMVGNRSEDYPCQ